MRIEKIRGHKRIWADIEKWRNSNLKLDLENLESRERDYTKIWIHPFSGFSLLNSQFPEPKGETRKRILSGLLDIYESWKNQLDELNEPYYLKIWLYEPRFSKSQVVCAIGSSIDFYNITFHKPEKGKTLNNNNFGALKNKFEGFSWDYRLDEEFLDNTEIGTVEDFETEKDYLENIKWYQSKLKKPHRKIISEEPIGDNTEYYAFKMGVVWIGQKTI